MQLYRGYVNEVTFSLAPSEFILGSTFAFLGKHSPAEPDSAALFNITTVAYDASSGIGRISIPATATNTLRLGTLYCALKMISPDGEYPLGSLNLPLVLF